MRGDKVETLRKACPRFLGRCVEFSIHDGWFDLILDASRALEAICERQEASGEPVMFATRVRSKYGSLQFYAEGVREAGDAVIGRAECLSESTCEICGAPGTEVERGDWVATLCGPHANEWQVVGGRLFRPR